MSPEGTEEINRLEYYDEPLVLLGKTGYRVGLQISAERSLAQGETQRWLPQGW